MRIRIHKTTSGETGKAHYHMAKVDPDKASFPDVNAPRYDGSAVSEWRSVPAETFDVPDMRAIDLSLGTVPNLALTAGYSMGTIANRLLIEPEKMWTDATRITTAEDELIESARQVSAEHEVPVAEAILVLTSQFGVRTACIIMQAMGVTAGPIAESIDVALNLTRPRQGDSP